MKCFIFAFVLTFVFNLCANAQTDTLVITLKNSQIDKIAVSDIQKIKFENITGVDDEGNGGMEGKGASSLVTKGNYPNPFKEQTSIEFEIGNSGNVKIMIYDNSGNHIQTLNCDNCKQGKNILLWNCLDKNNNRVQSGVYFYEVHYEKEVLSRKMILVK